MSDEEHDTEVVTESPGLPLAREQAVKRELLTDALRADTPLSNLNLDWETGPDNSPNFSQSPNFSGFSSNHIEVIQTPEITHPTTLIVGPEEDFHKIYFDEQLEIDHIDSDGCNNELF